MRGGAIKSVVGKYFNIEIDSLGRVLTYTRPRQIAMYLCRKHTKLSLNQIALLFKKKDHTTVISNIRRIEKLLREDEDLRDSVEVIEQILEGRTKLTNYSKEE